MTLSSHSWPWSRSRSSRVPPTGSTAASGYVPCAPPTSRSTRTRRSSGTACNATTTCRSRLGARARGPAAVLPRLPRGAALAASEGGGHAVEGRGRRLARVHRAHEGIRELLREGVRALPAPHAPGDDERAHVGVARQHAAPAQGAVTDSRGLGDGRLG